MLRHLSIARNVLSRPPLSFNVRLGPTILQPAQRHKGSSKIRDTCPKPVPPPPPPPKDDTMLWATVAMAICTGAFAVYAKHNPEVRDWISIHASWFDEVIAFAYEENQSHADFISCRFNKLKTDAQIFFNIKEKEPCELDVEGKRIVIQDPKYISLNEEGEVCETPQPPPIITKNICEVEQCLKELAESIDNNFFSAKEICAYYNNLVEETMANFSVKKLNYVLETKEERDELVRVSLANAETSKTQLEHLTCYLGCGVDAPKEDIASLQQMLKDYHDRIKTSVMEYQWQYDKSIAYDVQVKQVKATLKRYTDELKVMYPGLDYDADKPSFDGDADLLLCHTLKYIKYLQSKLPDAQAAMTERVDRSLKTALPQDEPNVKKNTGLVDAGFKKSLGDLDKEYKKKYDDMKKENDERFKTEMKSQLEASLANLEQQLQKKEEEMTADLDQLIEKQVAAEKILLKGQLEQMASKLKNVEDKLNEHLKAEEESKRSQELWTAGQALLAATTRGEPLINVQKEIRALEQAAGDDDQLVNSVLKAIPDSVREEGLIPASQLRERYHTMESTALKVALVEQDGGILPVYFMSWLQWALLCLRLSDIPKSEIDKPPTCMKHLDTFDILLRSRYWVENGNIALALRYLNSLEGASWGAAYAWRQNARAYLETKQAAEAVIAHAAALALRYI